MHGWMNKSARERDGDGDGALVASAAQHLPATASGTRRRHTSSPKPRCRSPYVLADYAGATGLLALSPFACPLFHLVVASSHFDYCLPTPTSIPTTTPPAGFPNPTATCNSPARKRDRRTRKVAIWSSVQVPVIIRSSWRRCRSESILLLRSSSSRCTSPVTCSTECACAVAQHR
ncbi:hypothetical protein E2562_036821 [Oryza meyeriana var. granulata]|uniref:Uncharacterized protein n=1 Tax=Oryza meyeriana var. granulata TaxID=110450 RepID=A0A6G1E7P9_9ORYZ|nr:hypothetical protein E2562_036821 [Oryza meyeriana var. granulata]